MKPSINFKRFVTVEMGILVVDSLDLSDVSRVHLIYLVLRGGDSWPVRVGMNTLSYYYMQV